MAAIKFAYKLLYQKKRREKIRKKLKKKVWKVHVFDCSSTTTTKKIKIKPYGMLRKSTC